MRFTPLIVPLALVILTFVAGGCTSYRIALVRPAEIGQTLSSQEAVIELPPLSYRVNDLNGRIGLRIMNDSDVVMTLPSEKNYVVDAAGQSRQLLASGAAIAPHSYLAISIPPYNRASSTRSGVGFGIGVGSGGGGGGVGGGVGIGHSFGGDDYGNAGYHAVPEWTWETGDIRVHIACQRGADMVQQDFTFNRSEIK